MLLSMVDLFEETNGHKGNAGLGPQAAAASPE